MNVGVDGHSTPAFVDNIDGDGDFDLIGGNKTGTFNYYENTGSSSSALFVERTGMDNPLNSYNVGGTGYSTPAFVDIDGDNDYDAFSGKYNGTFNYYENTGDKSSPVFVERTGANNPLNSQDVVGLRSSPAFADIDDDKDFDIFSGEGNSGMFRFYENMGDKSNAVFFQYGAYVDSKSAPAFADIDNDEDFDLFSGTSNGKFTFFENTSDSSGTAFIERTGTDNPLNSEDVGDRSKPTFIDIDDDKDFDLVSGEIGGTFKYYENTGSSSSPVFVERTGTDNPLDSLDVGDYSTPAFADIDDDDDFDLISGERFGTFKYYENTGSSSNPTFEERTGIDNPLNSMDAGNWSAPAFIDIDGDGDFDVVSGEAGGMLKYYENTGSSMSPVFEERTGTDISLDSYNPLNSYDVENESTPAFADIDGDGDLDAVVGDEIGGIFHYFQYELTPLSDLSVSITDLANEMYVGQQQTFTIIVENLGSDTALNPTLTYNVPSEFFIISATNSHGECSGYSTVTCTEDSISKDESATVTITIMPLYPAEGVTHTVSVSSSSPDPDDKNNITSGETTIIEEVEGTAKFGLIKDYSKSDKDKFIIKIENCSGLHTALAELETSQVYIDVGSFSDAVNGASFDNPKEGKYKYSLSKGDDPDCPFCRKKYQIRGDTIILKAKGMNFTEIDLPIKVSFRIGQWSCLVENEWKGKSGKGFIKYKLIQ